MIETIPIDKIHPDPKNVRKDLGDLTGLAASIKSLGILQALLVRPHDTTAGEYFLVAGERRLGAAKLAGIAEVPALIRVGAGDRKRNLAEMFVENFQRKELTPLEEAYGIHELVDEHKISQRGLADMVGCNQSHISRRLKLLKLPAAIQKEIDAETLFVRDAEELAALADHPTHLAAALAEHRRYPNRVTLKQAVVDQQKRIAAGAEKERSIDTLTAAGVKIVDHPGAYNWFNSKAKPLGKQHHYDVNVTEAKHRGEACHAAAIDPETGGIVYVCTDPKKHQPKGSTTSTSRRRQSPEDKAAAQRRA